ncbi:FG-GAP repeat protein [Streptomyces sp. PSKA54]|uniref:FG-GAP repeat protein n=1 Tax=Streptomyces himalayensis subsp. aureolus TaxID=2758039 RepID=A0A7W2CXP6_9ACTN|nr:FG-GAP repeat protein [Streptomyces himalayensis]MBA4860979.1 FG-GAP repeat protein [Streptomyces himalayensis subsp. aureolus]
MRIRTVTAVAALLTAGISPLAVTAPASAAAAKYADDFNGDGYRDYANAWGSGSKGGGVRVTFGTATGPGTKTQVVTQASDGVPGADEADDFFGDTRAAGDFNSDGYGDLAVGAIGEDIGENENQGGVTILWGSASGLKGGTALANKGEKLAYGNFGDDLAVGDFNGDAKADLAVVNAHQTLVYRGGFTRSGTTGAVTKLAQADSTTFDAEHLVAGKVTSDSKTDLVVVGSDWGDDATEAWFIKGGSTSLSKGATIRIDPSAVGTGDGVIADFNKDGYGDIAIGAPYYKTFSGAVSVWRGGASAPGTMTRITQATSGVAGTPETDDFFGGSLSAADVNGDGYKDLAIGAPNETIDGVESAGGFHLLRGGSGGLTGTGSQWFARNTAGVPGAIATADQFGTTVRLRDTDKDGHADLFVTGFLGSYRLPGATSGLTSTGVSEVDYDLVDGFLQ